MLHNVWQWDFLPQRQPRRFLPPPLFCPSSPSNFFAVPHFSGPGGFGAYSNGTPATAALWASRMIFTSFHSVAYQMQLLIKKELATFTDFKCATS